MATNDFTNAPGATLNSANRGSGFVSIPSGVRCPKCGGHLHRIRRRPIDRLLSWFVAVQRFRCDEFNCEWQGNVRKSRLRATR